MKNAQRQRPIDSSRFEELLDLSSLVKSIFYIAIAAVLLINLNVLQNGINESDISTFILLAIILLLFGINQKGHYQIAGWGLFISISVVITYNLSIAGGIHDNAMVVFPVLITLSGLLFGRRIVPVMTAVILAEVLIIYRLTITGVITPFNGAIVVHLQHLITVVILLLVSGVLIWLTINVIENGFLQVMESEKRLSNAYDQTLDGWGKALELFDKETEGHSLRVTDLTLRMAYALDLSEEDIEQIRRGALLHDIGKMGVPDEVLNKPGALTPEERQLIEMHPLHTYNLLKDIPFLQKALEIPFCHHERWDGTGYPRKLKGEEIPLAARIFAIIDNWDALTSDRPYRKAWSEQKTFDYLQEEKEKKFDPRLVDLFIQIVEKSNH